MAKKYLLETFRKEMEPLRLDKKVKNNIYP
jgi:hypothetical protein